MSEFSSSVIFVVQGLGATLLNVVFTKLQALEISSHGISPDMTAGRSSKHVLVGTCILSAFRQSPLNLIDQCRRDCTQALSCDDASDKFKD